MYGGWVWGRSVAWQIGVYRYTAVQDNEDFDQTQQPFSCWTYDLDVQGLYEHGRWCCLATWVLILVAADQCSRWRNPQPTRSGRKAPEPVFTPRLYDEQVGPDPTPDVAKCDLHKDGTDWLYSSSVKFPPGNTLHIGGKNWCKRSKLTSPPGVIFERHIFDGRVSREENQKESWRYTYHSRSPRPGMG
jgi:hypothetical protein